VIEKMTHSIPKYLAVSRDPSTTTPIHDHAQSLGHVGRSGTAAGQMADCKYQMAAAETEKSIVASCTMMHHDNKDTRCRRSKRRWLWADLVLSSMLDSERSWVFFF